MTSPSPPHDAAFRVTLPTFEGPLDLLLHLARKHELDLLDLPIAFITERYLEYLNLMQELDLDMASEYLLMAATLAYIKSKMLLPPSPEEEEDEAADDYMEDPRAELIKRLLEYQKYRHAAEELGSRSIAGRDVFPRGTPAPTAQGEAPLAEISLFRLLDAFEGILKRLHGSLALEVTSERITIQERMTQITERLQAERRCTFESLFESVRTRYDVVVTFLAILEMTKMHMTRLYQSDVEAPIHVELALLDVDAPTVPPPGTITSDGGDGSFADEAAAEPAQHASTEDTSTEDASTAEASPEGLPSTQPEPRPDADEDEQEP